MEEANQKATQLNIMFMETSAKAGHNVKSLFKKIAMSLVGMEKENEQSEAANTSTCYYTFYLAFSDSPSIHRDRRHITTTERGARRVAVPVLSFPHRARAQRTSSYFLYACMYFLTTCIPSCPLYYSILDVVVLHSQQPCPSHTLRATCYRSSAIRP